MPINRKTSLGQIRISDNAIATLAGTTVNECYGVVGMISKNYLADGYSALLKKENYSKGVVVKNDKQQLQERVKYALEKTLNMDVNSVNVHIEGILVNE